MRAVLIAFVVAACTSSSGGGGDDGPGTSHVVSFDVLASAPGACLDRELADADSETAGLQIDCSVSDVHNFGKANQSESVLPACNNAMTPPSSTNKPCWVVATDAVSCTMGTHQILRVERAEAPAADTHVVAQCLAI